MDWCLRSVDSCVVSQLIGQDRHGDEIDPPDGTIQSLSTNLIHTTPSPTKPHPIHVIYVIRICTYVWYKCARRLLWGVFWNFMMPTLGSLDHPGQRSSVGVPMICWGCGKVLSGIEMMSER